MSVEIVKTILKASLIPLNKSEFKFIEYKADLKKLFGLCEVFNVDIKNFDDILKNKSKLTQQQINEFLNISTDDIAGCIDSKIINSTEYNKELLKELFKKFDFSTSESINRQTNSIDFIKLFEEITHKTTENLNFSEEGSTTNEETTQEESSTEDNETDKNENKNNGIKYLILLFRELGIISKDKRTSKINPEFTKYFIKYNQVIKPILNEIQIDFDYFEPKKTNGRIIRPLKLLKVINEQSPNRKNTTKKELLEELIASDFIEISKQDRQTYYYIKKGLTDDFHKWLLKTYF